MDTWTWRSTRSGLSAAAVACATLALAAAEAVAQPAPFAQLEVGVEVDSGFVTSPAKSRGAAYSTIVSVPGATWIRLTFDQVVLGEAPQDGQPTTLVITSLLDGACQHHTALTLRQWNDTSAYFNGEGVRLEIIADPGAGPSRVAISKVLAGVAQVGGNGICGPTDDRLPSTDPRVCRGAPNGCTAFMISDYSNCFLSAGHCNLNFALVEFNVPLSGPDGIPNHPGPEDQYVLDQSSIQSSNGGIGNDWMYFGCFANTETGLTAYQAQGAAFDLAASPPPVAGQTIRATGYGIDFTPPIWNEVQQTSTGPYFALFNSTIQFQVDSQSGNSGSPLVNENNGLAIGILTHGGCVDNFGANHGTGSNNLGLQAALDDPRGLCLPAPPLAFVFPNGLPQFIDPSADPIRVEAVGANGGSPQPGTGVLHYDAGGGFVGATMVEVAPNVYDAVFPRLGCFLPVVYYFSAQATSGEVVENPLLAPGEHYSAVVASGLLERSLVASDVAAGDFFGISVATSGGVAVVGAFGDENAGPGSGSAYVFMHQGPDWVQEQKLLASDGAAGDSFGYAVAVSGDVAVVGAFGDADIGPGSGSAYVFRHRGPDWVQEQKLLASDGAAGDFFGVAVAAGGDLIVIGAIDDDDNGFGSGSAYVFRYDGSAWVQEQKLLATDGASGDAFGNSVAMSGGAAVVGAYAVGDNGINSGAAYVFRYDGSAWVQEQKLLASDGVAGDLFGYSVALSGDVALIGATGSDDSASMAGSVYEFKYSGSAWSQGQKLLASGGAEGERFGGAVAVEGDVAVVGASGAGGNGANVGAAYVFRHNGSSWIQAQKLLAPQGAAGDSFGVSAAVSGEVAVLGAWGDDGNGSDSGSAEIFQTLCSACRFDLDGNGNVGIGEFLALLLAWGTSPGGPPDFDGDGTVGQGDLQALMAAWGACG